MRNAPWPKGTETSNFLSMKRTFECIVNALFCCLDIGKTANLGFTLSRKCIFFEKRCFFPKKRKIFSKMFGGMKKVVFLQPQI